MIVIIKGDATFGHLAAFFNKNLLGAVHHHFTDIRVIQQRLNGTKTCHLIQDLIKDLFTNIFRQRYFRLNIHIIQALFHDLATIAKLQDFAKRLGWTFKWVSSNGTDFNYDFEVSFRPEALARGDATYNFAKLQQASSDMPGISVFSKDESGAVFRTYSTFGRGLDMMNTAYQYLDLVPKGRDEAGLPYTMAWVKLRDLYDR